MNTLKNELQKLYSDASKHSVYQNIPDFVSAELGYTESIDEAWRGDRPRLTYLLAKRTPEPGERWLDFGANTGFFTLSLAKKYPKTAFIAVEANPNHARFISSVARYFRLDNIVTIQRAIGLRELGELPQCDFLLHLNVLHHAGHDFDTDLVSDKSRFPEYSREYLKLLSTRTNGMLFQIGSNWGGNKSQPLVEVHDNVGKVKIFSGWLRDARWHIHAVSCARHDEDGLISYQDLPGHVQQALNINVMSGLQEALSEFELDRFPGEFYRRPLFLCDAVKAT